MPVVILSLLLPNIIRCGICKYTLCHCNHNRPPAYVIIEKVIKSCKSSLLNEARIVAVIIVVALSVRVSSLLLVALSVSVRDVCHRIDMTSPRTIHKASYSYMFAFIPCDGQG